MHRIARALLILAVLAALAPMIASAGKGWCRTCDEPTARYHQTYSSVYPAPNSTAWYPDFYVSAGAAHWIQQTYPDNKICYHRIYHRATGTLIVGLWLEGNGANGPYPDYFGFGNQNATSQAFRHSVSGCSGQVQVYYWH